MKIDTVVIKKIFAGAEKENRNFLLEHEVYALLRKIGIQTPRFIFLPRGKKIDKKRLSTLKSEHVVLKIVCPLIAHKTDVGGVMFVRNSERDVRSTAKKMLGEVPGKFLDWAKKFGHSKDKKEFSAAELEKEIRGILILEKVAFEEAGFGSELLMGLRNSREFGPVVTMGIGGVDVEYLSEKLKKGKAVAINSAHLLHRNEVLSSVEPLAVYDKLVKEFRGRGPLISREELAETLFRFAKLGESFSPFRKGASYVIEEMEVNPFVVRQKKLLPLDGLCRFSRNHLELSWRPIENIDALLHPLSVGIIGVSEKMNMGHIILNNILREGFPPDRVYVVKPGLDRIEECRCFPTIAELPEAVDLFVLTLPAEQSFEVMKDLVSRQKARSVIIIAGGIGEKRGTEGLEDKIKNLLKEGRSKGSFVPIVNGGNCLGIYSKPGRYDTTFVPEYKLARPTGENPRVVFISQSGAFMISRMSKNPRIEPLYGISLGNQIDLTASDYLNYFKMKTPEEAKVFALYIEGFKPADGFSLAKAAADLIKKGKKVVVYKAGRTLEGRAATSSHTASVAGDYEVCRSILENTGVFLAEDIFEFENSIKGMLCLENKIVQGNRVGLISNAGFECVIMADNIKNRYELHPAEFSGSTKARLSELLAPLGIDRLQDIHNPLDLTPVATDAAFAGCAEAVLDDPDVDCAVISPVPMTAALQTVEGGEGHQENIYAPQSIGSRLIEIFQKTSKPFVVNIDAGDIYQPLVDMLEEAEIPVFRRSDEALRFLRKYIAVSLRREKPRRG